MSAIQAGDVPTAAPHIAVRRDARVDRKLARFLSLDDFDHAAQRHLPRMLYGFIAGGAEDNAALKANCESYQDYSLVPRVLSDVSKRVQNKAIFGKTYASPFGIAPMGAASICAYRSDMVTARAASAAAIPMILSASSLIPLEEVKACGPDIWYQAYLPGDASRIEPLVERVTAAGYDTFVLTADVPVPANRENNIRNGFSVPLKPSVALLWQALTHPAWLIGTFGRTLLRHGMPHFENMDAARGAPIISRQLERAVGNRDQLSWEHVGLIRRRWRGPLVIKGILSAADARMAKECGADGIIVSNHGGRQLDSAVAPLRVLPLIVEAATGMTIMMDGGIRRGTDVLKALALGADFVFVGRPFLFAAAVGGERGVSHAIEILRSEIARDMALLGIRDLSEAGRDLVMRTG